MLLGWYGPEALRTNDLGYQMVDYGFKTENKIKRSPSFESQSAIEVKTI